MGQEKLTGKGKQKDTDVVDGQRKETGIVGIRRQIEIKKEDTMLWHAADLDALAASNDPVPCH